MEALLVSTGIVALAEVGDKTQLLSLVLAARFRRPAPIVLGILAATLANHALAAAVGAWAQAALGPVLLRWILGLSFLAMAVWALVPDRLESSGTSAGRYGVFGATLVAFFLVEMGDKTQIATAALAAQYAAFWSVVAGTTAGMMIANVPVVLFGERIARRLPVRLLRAVAAAVFAAFGAAVLLDLCSAG
ncbi:MAG: TMEM165/GDT1 family protein [Burkholderiales bacterium]|nr:TMEM165/GDT1 family protein [Burkholderiales bacterium]